MSDHTATLFFILGGLLCGPTLSNAQEPKKTVVLEQGDAAPMDGRLYSTTYDEKVRRSLKEAAAKLKACAERKKLGEEARAELDVCIEGRSADAAKMRELSTKLKNRPEPKPDLLTHALYIAAIVASSVGTTAACVEVLDLPAAARQQTCYVGGVGVGAALGIGLVW